MAGNFFYFFIFLFIYWVQREKIKIFIYTLTLLRSKRAYTPTDMNNFCAKICKFENFFYYNHTDINAPKEKIENKFG